MSSMKNTNPSPPHSRSMVLSPQPHRSRRSRSVCSATSNVSVRLSAIIRDSFPQRMSVLNDDTDIQIPGRQSWWRKIGDNTRDLTEIMEINNGLAEKDTNVVDEFDVEILNHENENTSIDLPESSDGESIHSIIIPQRKIFANQQNHQKKSKKIIRNRETNIRKSYLDQSNIDINVLPKQLFNPESKPKTKPVFTAALLNASPNKTANKSIEKPVQGQVRNLFGKRSGVKRKNAFTAFLLSDSEDEIPDVQPKVFEFQNKIDILQTGKPNHLRRSSQNSSVSNVTDAEISQWQHLPSSTMVEHQFHTDEPTPVKKSKLSQLLQESEVAPNHSINKSTTSNNSNNSNSSNLSNKSNDEIIQTEVEELDIINTHSKITNISTTNNIITTNNSKSVKETSVKNNSKLVQDKSLDETLTEENMQVDVLAERDENMIIEEKQHNDEFENEDFTLKYDDNDEQIFDVNMKDSQNGQKQITLDQQNQEVEQEHQIINNISRLAQQNDPNNADNNISKSNEQYSVNEAQNEISEQEQCEVNNQSNYNPNKTNQYEVQVGKISNQDNEQLDNDKENVKENTVLHEQQNAANNSNYRLNKDTHIDNSPEAVLHDKTSRRESFTTQGRQTSVSKSKTINMIKEHSIRPSLASDRDSIGFTDGTINSSAEGSGWDSHRTTRKTLRQTFGKDFTPRKSLRTLVMEKAAKRHTIANDQIANQSNHQSNGNELRDQSKQQSNFIDVVSDTIKKPLANSTELPDFESYSEQEQSEELEFEKESERMPETNSKTCDVASSQEQENVEGLNRITKNVSKENLTKLNVIVSSQETVEEFETNTDQERVGESETDRQPEIIPEAISTQLREVDSSQEEVEEFNSDTEQEQLVDSNRKSSVLSEANSTLREFGEEEVEFESDVEQKQAEDSESDTEPEHTPDANSTELRDSGQEEVEFESDRELQQSEEVESVSDIEQEEAENSESDTEPGDMPDANSTELPDYEPQENQEDEEELDTEQDQVEEMESSREAEPLEESDNNASKRMKLTNLETYLVKVRQENAETRRKMEEQVINSLKMARKPFNPFKMPEVPKLNRVTKVIKKTATPKLKPSLFSNNILPPEFLEDMKYKPPKRFQGKNAPWITKRLYKYLEDKLEPKYEYRARVRAEKLVERLYEFAKEVRKSRAAPPDAVRALKHEMARLDVVTTHHDFYCFFHEFMPREIRIRVNPDILNKIPAPRRMFANIIEE